MPRQPTVSEKLRPMADALLESHYNGLRTVRLPLLNPVLIEPDVLFLEKEVAKLTGTPVAREREGNDTILVFPKASVNYLATPPKEPDIEKPVARTTPVVAKPHRLPPAQTGISAEVAGLMEDIIDANADDTRTGVTIPKYSRYVTIDKAAEPELAAEVLEHREALVAKGIAVRSYENGDIIEVSKKILGKAGRRMSSASTDRQL